MHYYKIKIIDKESIRHIFVWAASPEMAIEKAKLELGYTGIFENEIVDIVVERLD